jgi:hypothetical protein
MDRSTGTTTATARAAGDSAVTVARRRGAGRPASARAGVRPAAAARPAPLGAVGLPSRSTTPEDCRLAKFRSAGDPVESYSNDENHSEWNLEKHRTKS